MGNGQLDLGAVNMLNKQSFHTTKLSAGPPSSLPEREHAGPLLACRTTDCAKPPMTIRFNIILNVVSTKPLQPWVSSKGRLQ